MSRRLQLVLLGGLCLLAGPVSLAVAAPVTVDLRIEGKTKTLYEGRVTTDIRTVDMGDGTGAHLCDGTPGNPTPAPTRGAAFMTAAQGPGGFTFTGAYTFDMTFSVIAGDDVSYNPVTSQYLGEYKNGISSNFGSCGDQIANGDKVLYGYATFGAPALELSGPAMIVPGVPATLKVTDAGTGAPVAGASVGGQTTGTDGIAAVTLAAAGPTTFKATKTGAIRSNAVTVCATTGSDGACGTSLPVLATAPVAAACATNGHDGRCATRDLTAPGATITGIRDGQRFATGKGPRRLLATIDGDPSGVLAVKLRLTRTNAGHVTYLSGRSERFKPNHSGVLNASGGFWFGVGSAAQVDYLLAQALPRGRYVLDVNAIDKAYNRDDVRRRGANRVVFHVG